MDFDWFQVLYSLIGSFFGFGFALIAQSFFTRFESKKNYNRMVNNINNELGKVKNEMNNNIEAEGILAFDTPIWSAVLSTGYILQMIEKGEKQKNSCNVLIKIYNKIFALKKMEEESLSDFESYKDDIFALRKDIVKDINNYFC